jgi:hypothetical protein
MSAQNIQTFSYINKNGQEAADAASLIEHPIILIEHPIIVAARNGNLAATQTLLSTGSVSEEDRSMAILGAAHRGRLEILQLLLTTGTISEKTRGLALRSAIVNTSQSCADFRKRPGLDRKERGSQWPPACRPRTVSEWRDFR